MCLSAPKKHRDLIPFPRAPVNVNGLTFEYLFDNEAVPFESPELKFSFS